MRGWWALCLFLDVFFGGERVGFMPLFRCIYFFRFFFLKVYHFFLIFFLFLLFGGRVGVGPNASF